MKPRSIGIVGGAGPMAGASLFQRIIELATNRYGCKRDADFPEIFLYSFPFSEMLREEKEDQKIRDELKASLSMVRKNGASIVTIACNTLHAFLEPSEAESADLVHLPRSVAAALSDSELPLVLCTSTSRQLALHQRFFPCLYPDPATQKETDALIDLILQGAGEELVRPKLQAILERQEAKTIVLGCTELSLFSKNHHKNIIDPLEIVASEILKKKLCRFPYNLIPLL